MTGAAAEFDPASEGVVGPMRGTPQERFLASSADISIVGGGAGGGKTIALLLEPLRHIHRPRFRCVTFRRTRPQIMQEGGLWDTAGEIYPALGAEANKNELSWTFPSGARHKMAHMQYEKDRFSWKSAQIPLIQFDQLEDFTETQFWYMLSRNRSVHGVTPYIRASCNPVPEEDATGGWLRRLIDWWIADDGYAHEDRSGEVRWFFRERDEIVWADSRQEAIQERDRRGVSDEVEPKSLTFVESLVTDNEILLEENPEYVSSLHALSHVEQERLRHGNWNIRATAGEFISREWLVNPERGREKLGTLGDTPDDTIWVRYWDTAATQGGGSYTAGVLVGYSHEHRTAYIGHVRRGQWSAGRRDEVIRETAISDAERLGAVEYKDGEPVVRHPGVSRIYVEQEPGGGGKASAEVTVQKLHGFPAESDRVTGGKFARARAFAAACENGDVRIISGAWNEPYLEELHRADPSENPDNQQLDQMDGSSGAFNKLTLELKPTPVYERVEAGGGQGFAL